MSGLKISKFGGSKCLRLLKFELFICMIPLDLEVKQILHIIIRPGHGETD